MWRESTDFAKKFEDSVIWTSAGVTLQTVTDDIKFHGKVHANVSFGYATYHQFPYVADNTDTVILEIEFRNQNNFKLDFKTNDLQTDFEYIAMCKIENRNTILVSQVKNETVIPLRSEITVPSTLSKECNFRYGFVEYLDNENTINSVLVASSHGDLSRIMVPVRVVNLSDKPKIMNEDQVLVTYAIVTSVKS